jgi:carbon storage regulator CsrA
MPLILSRKQQETVIANGPVTVRVVRIAGNRVLLAFDGHPDTLILRGELERKEPTDGQPKNGGQTK